MELHVELRKGGLIAVAQLVSGPFNLDAATEQVMERLSGMGVVNGIQRESVRRALSRLAVPEPPPEGVLVAKGKPPQPPVNAQVKSFFPVRETPLAEGIDPFTEYAENVAFPGQMLLQKTQAVPGSAGNSLRGTPIPAPQAVDVPVIAGDGVVWEEKDGIAFRAETYGVVLFHRGRLSVLPALAISDDRMEARMTILPDPHSSEEQHVARLLDALGKLDVRQGVDEHALIESVKMARSTGRAVKDVLVARGRAPRHGRAPGYELLFDPERKVGKSLAGGRIDFREAEAVKNVRKGDALAKMLPGSEPEPGFLVTGTSLQARTETISCYKPGQNTETSQDGEQIVAGVDGMIVLKRGKFHVVDEYLVSTDVDYGTGNIRATGSVHVRGSVKPGFQVQAGRSAEILGDVEEAQIKAGGDVIVRGGVTAGSRIVAGQSVKLKYLQNSRVDAGGDLEVKLSVTNSEVYAKGKIVALTGQGAILGGEVNAAMGIEARTIGSSSSQTHVAVGVDLKVVRELEEIDKRRSSLLEEIKILQSHLGANFLKDPRAALAAIPAGLRKGKLEALQKIKDLYQKDSELGSRRDELAAIDQELHNARIAVRGAIHAGTTVTVGPVNHRLAEALTHVVLYYDPEGNRVGWRKL